MLLTNLDYMQILEKLALTLATRDRDNINDCIKMVSPNYEGEIQMIDTENIKELKQIIENHFKPYLLEVQPKCSYCHRTLETKSMDGVSHTADDQQ